VPGDDFPIWNNPAYTVFDLNIGMAWSDWEVLLLVENVFDEDYYIDAQEFPNFAPVLIPQSAVIIGTVERTRRIMAVLNYQFGQ
jgi:outer membrane receptor protein involved in Fe transport